MVRIRTLLILFIAVSGILATIAFISYNQLQSAPPAPPEEELEFWYEICSVGNDPGSTCVCGVSTVPVRSPQTFSMSTIVRDDEMTLHTHYFGTELNSGAKIVFVINATAPVDFQLVFVNRTTDDIDAASMPRLARVGKLTIDALHITSYRHELNVREKGIYIFVFDVAQPKPVATVTFEAGHATSEEVIVATDPELPEITTEMVDKAIRTIYAEPELERYLSEPHEILIMWNWPFDGHILIVDIVVNKGNFEAELYGDLMAKVDLDGEKIIEMNYHDRHECW